MKYRLKTNIVNAIQWKGWPHKIKGLEEHPKYPQLGYIRGIYGNYYDIFEGDWIIKSTKGYVQTIMDKFNFENTYERIK